MESKKEQKIIVYLSLLPSDKNLILNGIKIASIFKKELCLLYNYSKKEKTNLQSIKNVIQSYSVPILKEIQQLKISTLLISERSCDVPEKLADDLEAIFIIAPASQFSKYSRAVIKSRIPFLFVNEKNNTISKFKNLIFPIDLRKESSDTVLWGSYFGRYNESKIVAVAANDKGKDAHKKITKNVESAKKLFQNLKLTHKIYKGSRSSLRNTFETFEFAQSSRADLLIILGSSTITPLDYIIGLPERKIIKKAGSFPVLIINARKDNYILCD